MEPRESDHRGRPMCSWPSALLPGLTLTALLLGAAGPTAAGDVTVYEMTVTAVASVLR